MMTKIYHVQYDARLGNWILRMDGRSFQVNEFDSKDAALNFSKKYARAVAPSLLKIRSREGRLESEWFYGINGEHSEPELQSASMHP